MGREEVWADLGLRGFRASSDGELEFADPGIEEELSPSRLVEIAKCLPADGSRVDFSWGEVQISARAKDGGVVGVVMPRGTATSFRLLYEDAPIAMHAVDERAIVVDVNREWARLTGYSPDEAIGKPITFLMAEESARRAIEEVMPALHRDGRVRGIPYEFVRADGTIIAVELDCDISWHAGAGQVVSLVRDVTERNRGLRLLQAKLTQSDRLATMGMLAASIAHEVNNPLTYVMHYIERLERDLASMQASIRDPETLSPRLTKLAAGARTAAEGCTRVRDIVRDLKTFGRTDDGENVPIDVNRALRSALQMAGHQVRRRARLKVGLGALPAVRAHDGRLCQVFLNLLLNAAQAIDPQRGVDDHFVEVRSWTHEGDVHVSIKDTGHGIDEEFLPRLFEPFFTTKSDGVGTGLGLWICQEIVEDLGGRIMVESAAGKGSTFVVVLPKAPNHPFVESSIPSPGLASPVDAVPRFRRVLVIDDEPALRELLAEALGEHADVVTASGGSEARELLQHDPEFDAILCDLMMPGMSGEDLYVWIRTTFPPLAERMIFMTGASHSRGAREFLATVANERLDKPFRVRELERLLDRVFESSIEVHA